MEEQVYFLESERLYLREFEEMDLDLLYHLDSDPEVMEFIGSPKTIPESLERYQEAIVWLDKALEIDPTYEQAQNNKEYALTQLMS